MQKLTLVLLMVAATFSLESHHPETLGPERQMQSLTDFNNDKGYFAYKAVQFAGFTSSELLMQARLYPLLHAVPGTTIVVYPPRSIKNKTVDFLVHYKKNCFVIEVKTERNVEQALTQAKEYAQLLIAEQKCNSTVAIGMNSIFIQYQMQLRGAYQHIEAFSEF